MPDDGLLKGEGGIPVPPPTPEQIHALEQRWTAAQEVLEGVLEAVRVDIPIVKAHTGLSDGSIIFDYMFAFILKQHLVDKERAQTMTQIMCAAALTRLARAPRAEDPLAQLEKEMSDDSDN